MRITTDINRGFSETLRIKEIISNHGFICGGYARWMISPRINPVPPADIDIYAYSINGYDTIRRNIEQFYGIPIKFESARAITYDNQNLKINIDPKLRVLPPIQLIKPLEGMVSTDPNEVVDKFDFTVIRCWYDANDGVVNHDTEFMKDEASLRLRIKNIHCPFTSLRRCIKYTKRGYKLLFEEMIKIFEDYAGRPESYKNECKELISRISNVGEDVSPADLSVLQRLFYVD